jgi:hypothetical protein
MRIFTPRIGGRGRDRTGDPLLAKQVLSQLSYTPTCNHMIVMDFECERAPAFWVGALLQLSPPPTCAWAHPD